MPQKRDRATALPQSFTRIAPPLYTTGGGNILTNAIPPSPSTVKRRGSRTSSGSSSSTPRTRKRSASSASLSSQFLISPPSSSPPPRSHRQHTRSPSPPSPRSSFLDARPSRSLSSASSASLSTQFLITPASSSPPYRTHRHHTRTPSPSASFSPPLLDACPPKSLSSPHLPGHVTPPSSLLSRYAYRSACIQAESDSELELRQDHSMLYTAQKLGQGSSSFRTRLWTSAGGRQAKPAVPKSIATGPGQTCAGETETETDEPPRHLPTARIVPSSGPIVPPHTLEQLLTPLLFEASRLLSIVPAVFGTLYNVYYVWHPPLDGKNTRVDYVVSALWAILTGVQCLLLTTGLLHRWKVYYPPLSTLIRLLALQAICWPATHLTLSVFEYDKRPVICWAVIGSTTCVSRSIQLWVTSNLWWETDGRGEGKGWRLKLGGRWGGRRWDWVEVLVKCMLPMGICYFVMAWAEALRREWDGC